MTGRFASHGSGAHSPGRYSLLACLVAELVLTYFFVLVIHGATDKRALAAIQQLWLFWVAPILGGAIAGQVYNGLFEEGKWGGQQTQGRTIERSLLG